MEAEARPYCHGPDLVLGLGLLNPASFKEPFKRHPWFPFEDLYFSVEEIEPLLRGTSKEAEWYWQDMPWKGESPNTYRIADINRLDALKVEEWLSYFEGILWSKAGCAIIHSFSDLVVLSIPDEMASAAFGMTSGDLYAQSKSVFTDGYQDDPVLRRFMSSVKETWPDGGFS